MQVNGKSFILVILSSAFLLGVGCGPQGSGGEGDGEGNHNDNVVSCVDLDGDGHGAGCAAGPDCHDNDAAIHPGAPELCNGLDDNCDGTVDEGVLNACGDCDPACDTGTTEECTPAGELAYDEDLDGEVDEGCGCTPGTTQGCCTIGIQVCMDGGDEFGGTWGACEGGAMGPEICGDGIDQDCDGVDEQCPDVEIACNASPHQTASFTLSFPGSNSACPWSQGDNEGSISGHHAARIEHVRSLDLPVNAAICSLDFQVPQSGMYFDDNFLIAFDEAVLMSNFNVDALLPNDGGLFIYDWSHVRAQPFISTQYCLGGGPCELPDTQNQGVISLDLSSTVTYALAQRALNLHRFDFMVYADGDNDPSLDCTYTAFTMEVQVEYVLP